MTTFSKIEERVKEQYHCWIIGKSLCVNLCASWQGRLANMPNLYSHSRNTLPTRLLAPKIEEAPPSESREPDSQHDYFLKNRRDTAPRISRTRPQHDCFLKNRRGIVLRINRRGARLLKSWAAQRPRGLISEIEEAPSFLALSAPVTRTLSFAEIMGILSKTSGEVEST
ncbi:hypothetical protein COP1_018957 [Malus domestica]